MLERRAEMVPTGRDAVAGMRIPALEPHGVLAAAAVAMLLAEVAAVKQGSAAWIVLGAATSACAFLVAWRSQERLRLVPLLVLTLGFQVAWIAVDLSLGVRSVDSSVLYRDWGNSLLHGHYPDAQYPPAAVLLFAFDALLGGGPTRAAHAFVMVPFQLVTVIAVWALRTRRSAWLAAIVALWPLNAFSWEFRFDLFPTALLALGLLFAWRERWILAGALLGLGAAAKWTPALSFALLVLWLVAGGRWRTARAHVLAFVGVFALLHLPFLVWSPGHTLYSYRYFHGQGVTGESIWYLLLAPLGRASVSMRQFWLPAHVAGWVNPFTTVAQIVVLLALAGIVWSVRANARAAIAVAAMAPVLFLLLNRVFSPQYLVLMVAAWAIAGALLLDTRREQLLLGAAVMTATTANALVYPYTLYQANLWRLASAAMFTAGFAVSVWIVWRALLAAGKRETAGIAAAAPVPHRSSVTAASADLDVSVVLPFRNAASTVSEQLEALASQDFSGRWELVAVDNRSEDESRQLVENFGDRLDLRVVEATARLGGGYASNVGARHARAEKLIFVDADDVVAPGFLAAIAAALDQHEFVTAAFDQETLNPSWVRAAHGPPWRDPDQPVDQFGVLPNAGASMGITRCLLDSVGGFADDLPRMYDIALSWEVQFAGTPLHFVPDAVYRVRYRDNLFDLFRQGLAGSSCAPLLYKRYRHVGMKRRTLVEMLRSWARLALDLAKARTKADVAPLGVQLGRELGRLSGSVRHRVYFP